VIVVLDSGIWISAFQFGGAPQAAVESVFSEHTVAFCDQIVAEIRATPVRKFSWKDEEVLAILTEYTSDGKHVEVTGAFVRLALRFCVIHLLGGESHDVSLHGGFL